MTLSELLHREPSNLPVLEAVSEVLLDKTEALSAPENTILTLWIYIATNPKWTPLPVDRNTLDKALRTVGENRLAEGLPSILTSPDFETASQILSACVRYLRRHASGFDLRDELQLRTPSALRPLPVGQMAAIFRDEPKAEPDL